MCHVLRLVKAYGNIGNCVIFVIINFNLTKRIIFVPGIQNRENRCKLFLVHFDICRRVEHLCNINSNSRRHSRINGHERSFSQHKMSSRSSNIGRNNRIYFIRNAKLCTGRKSRNAFACLCVISTNINIKIKAYSVRNIKVITCSKPAVYNCNWVNSGHCH